jgi:hypothetical protein
LILCDTGPTVEATTLPSRSTTAKPNACGSRDRRSIIVACKAPLSSACRNCSGCSSGSAAIRSDRSVSTRSIDWIERSICSAITAAILVVSLIPSAMTIARNRRMVPPAAAAATTKTSSAATMIARTERILDIRDGSDPSAAILAHSPPPLGRKLHHGIDNY